MEKDKNFACRVFKEQIELILQLPENERAEVLYKAILFGFNQIDCQFDNQNENQNESAYVSVSDSVSVLSNKIFNLLKKNITWKEFSNNYGGNRKGSGAPKGNTNAKKNNQNDNQTDNQIDCFAEKPKSKFTEESIICVNGQYFDEFPSECLPLLKKYWSVAEIEEIRKDLTCQPDHETTVAKLLLKYPPKPKVKRFVKPTIEEIKAYCEERKNSIDAKYFYDHYEGIGWKVGKNPMKDWKAVVRTWEKNNFQKQQPQKKNWSNYTGEGSFLKDAKDDPFMAEIYNKKD